MGGKDLYLLQIIQYNLSTSGSEPDHWAFYIHFTDKSCKLTGEGEVHEIRRTTTSYRYLSRRAHFITPEFRGAATLGLVFKKNLYKIRMDLESGKIKTGDPLWTSRQWCEDRLNVMRKSGNIILGPSLSDIAGRAYLGWLAHQAEKEGMNTLNSPKQFDDQKDDSTSGVVKRHYSYPYTLYAT